MVVLFRVLRLVAPLRVRGLKQGHEIKIMKADGVAPLRVRGLKLTIPVWVTTP